MLIRGCFETTPSSCSEEGVARVTRSSRNIIGKVSFSLLLTSAYSSTNMCAGIHHPTRGGTRGGKDQFDWEDVKTDKDRECYLGHSLMAPVGRWQKGKDLTWYNKKSKTKEYKAILEAERAAVKKAEEEAMAAALGLKPSTSVKSQQPLSKQEVAAAFRRQSQEDQDEGTEERIKGVGFSGRAQLRKRMDSSSNDLGAIFEHDTSDDVKGSMPAAKVSKSESSQPQPDSTTVTDRDRLRARLMAYLSKKASKDKSKKKKKKEKSSKETKKSRRRQETSSSSSDSDKWVEASPRHRPSHSKEHHRHKGRRSHSSDSDDEGRGQRSHRGHSNEQRGQSSHRRRRDRSSDSDIERSHRTQRRSGRDQERDSRRWDFVRSEHRTRDSDSEQMNRKHKRHDHSPAVRKKARYDH